MTLADVLSVPSLEKATVVAGNRGTTRDVTWVQVIDSPDPTHWTRPGQLVLTTGFAWPRNISGQRELLQKFANLGIAGIGLAVPQFFERVPDLWRAEGERLELPLIEIPWEVPFVQLTLEVHELLLREKSQVLLDSERIHQALTRTAAGTTSLESIAATLASLIGRSVLFLDRSGRVLASSGTRTDASEAERRHCEIASRHSRELLQQMEEAIPAPAAAYRNDTHPTKAIPTLNLGEGVICSIRLNSEGGGYVWVLSHQEPLSALDVRAAEHTALVAAVYLAHRRELASVEAHFRRSFLDTLLEGRFESTPQALERARMLAFEPEAAYRVGLICLDDSVPLSRLAFDRRERLADRLRGWLIQSGFPALVTASLNQVVFLLPAGANAQEVWVRVREGDAAMVTSRSHPGFDGAKRGYEEALASLPHLKPGHHLTYEELLLPRVMQGDPKAQASFADVLLAPLRRDRGGDKLITTLFAFAVEGFHLTRTAERLGIHISTLRYRLQRIEELAQLQLDDPKVRFRIQIAHYLSAES